MCECYPTVEELDRELLADKRACDLLSLELAIRDSTRIFPDEVAGITKVYGYYTLGWLTKYTHAKLSCSEALCHVREILGE